MRNGKKERLERFGLASLLLSVSSISCRKWKLNAKFHRSVGFLFTLDALLLFMHFIFWLSCSCHLMPFFLDGIWRLDFCLLITWPYIDAKLDVDEDHMASRSK